MKEPDINLIGNRGVILLEYSAKYQLYLFLFWNESFTKSIVHF